MRYVRESRDDLRVASTQETAELSSAPARPMGDNVQQFETFDSSEANWNLNFQCGAT
ncbi:unnamed protein product [Nesidiocoris tenuis]|uniref:Uncharacterized protein n=1 Tax=Nesidiocoris tenuis TaxID=355587 RepID=A0A6H5HRV7_9HEMI|nr:unnamed protein product [Nesidiocoris tenuis]